MGILDIFAPSDPELVKKTLARIDEQDKWNDVFSTKLIELLDNIDGLKKDIRERMRRVELVKVAESTLLDEAARTETLNTKLAEAKKALDLVRQEFQTAKFQCKSAEELCSEASAAFRESELRYSEAKRLAESATIEYQKAEETGKSSAHAYDESERQLVLSVQKLQEAGESTLEAKSLLDKSASQLDNSRIIEEKATADLRSADQVLEASKRSLIAASELFQRATRWVISGSVVSWIAVMWIVWSTFRTVLPLWQPCVTTAVFLLGGMLVLNGVKHEA